VYHDQGLNGAALSGSTTGITEHTVRVSLVVADLSLLTKEHLAPNIGNPVRVAQAVVDQINASGGVAGGRRIVLIPHVISVANATADTLNQVCLQATEEDQPLAVVIAAAVPVNVVQCVAVSHTQLAITMDSWQRQVYVNANGRIFSVADSLSADVERTWGALPVVLARVHALAGKRVGIISVDEPSDRLAAAAGVAASLSRLHIAVASEVTLPFPIGSLNCAETSDAIQRMKAAGVNFVFLVPQDLCGAAVVEAAQMEGYHPSWATAGDNVTNTVAKFFAPAAGNYNGAWGLGGGFPEPTPAAVRCNQLVSRRTGVHYPASSDAFGFTAATCLQIETLADALNAASGTLTQGAVVRALADTHTVAMSGGPPGSLSADKHDAGDWAVLERYHSSLGRFTPYLPRPVAIP
jgi:ABC-type branched-subunit amino acid transport system substrate-binding protein